MLKLEDIRFPITFHASAGSITFEDTYNGIWDNGVLSELGIGYFIHKANEGKAAYEMAQELPSAPEPPLPQPWYRLEINNCLLTEIYTSLTTAIAAAEKYAIKYNKVVRILYEAATISPKQITTTEVKYA